MLFGKANFRILQLGFNVATVIGGNWGEEQTYSPTFARDNGPNAIVILNEIWMTESREYRFQQLSFI